MSTYRILPLKFTAPVHFGDASGGGGLDAVQPVCRADTFFSALCCEAARMGKTELNRLVNKVSQEEIAFSDLFPWYLRDGSYEWYVPKPVISVQPKETKSETLQKARNLASFRKKSKKRAFLRASDLGLYIDDLRYGSASLEGEPVFGETLSAVHFNSRTRTPYSAGSYFFSPSAGLYVLIRMDDPAYDLCWQSVGCFTNEIYRKGIRSDNALRRAADWYWRPEVERDGLFHQGA